LNAQIVQLEIFRSFQLHPSAEKNIKIYNLTEIKGRLSKCLAFERFNYYF